MLNVGYADSNLDIFKAGKQRGFRRLLSNVWPWKSFKRWHQHVANPKHVNIRMPNYNIYYHTMIAYYSPDLLFIVRAERKSRIYKIYENREVNC